MLYYDRIGVTERIDVNKTRTSKECIICHHQYFLDKNDLILDHMFAMDVIIYNVYKL